MRVLLFLLLCSGTVQGAEIFGSIYSWETFEPVENVVVEINTTPEQMLVSRDGSYSFTVPEGSYLLRAKYYEKNLLRLEAQERVDVLANGSYRIDLILFPVLEEELLFEDIELLVPEEQKETGTSTYLLFLALILLLSAAAYLLHRRRAQEEPLPEDLSRVVEILKREGGRMKQSDLRRRLGCSEAKLSLMLAELEHRGRVRRFKKGRGKIVILK